MEVLEYSSSTHDTSKICIVAAPTLYDYVHEENCRRTQYFSTILAAFYLQKYCI